MELLEWHIFRGYASGCCRDQTGKALPILCNRDSGDQAKAPFSGYSCSSSPTSSPSSSPILRLLMQFSSSSRHSSRALWHRCGDGEECSRLSFGSSKRVTNAAPNLSQCLSPNLKSLSYNYVYMSHGPSFTAGQEPEVLHIKHKLDWEVHNVLERKTLWCLTVIEPNPSLVIEVPVVVDQELSTAINVSPSNQVLPWGQSFLISEGQTNVPCTAAHEWALPRKLRTSTLIYRESGENACFSVFLLSLGEDCKTFMAKTIGGLSQCCHNASQSVINSQRPDGCRLSSSIGSSGSIQPSPSLSFQRRMWPVLQGPWKDMK